ncbi:hypothetical protein BRARA_F02349 [Brassica rapa]|uniref:GRF-type domain-containing protein n=1 Tax=Brassica campestris TaxID=3711 RepID=A0A397Z6V2_BRACM|nr:uncharacterized protein At4g04775-like [Brassica rapa]RID59100.1 hypothetical protein BRARA_F02349 [Brassica rapa]
MSNESGASSGTSVGRGRVVGVPKRCWCGEIVVSLTSRLTANPYRRYYRCAFAAERKLSNDNHAYKWMDEALLDEIETLTVKTTRVEHHVLRERVEEERKWFEEMELKIEREMVARMEEALTEALTEGKCEMKKMMVFVVLGCTTMVVLSKLLG